jgi:hypothetical protein
MLPGNLGQRSIQDASRHTGQVLLFWETTVLSVVERVERFPTNVRREIASCVGQYIHAARTATGEANMTRFIEAAAGERATLAQKSAVNPVWSALALAEAWCICRLGLSNGTLDPSSAMSITNAIEDLAGRPADGVSRIAVLNEGASHILNMKRPPGASNS